MISTRGQLIALIATSACVSDLRLELPPTPPDMKSLLVAFESDAPLPGGDTIAIEAVDLEDPALRIVLPFAGPARGTVTLLFYRYSIDALELRPGRVMRGAGRRLPEAHHLEGSRFGGNDAVDWRTIDAPSGELRSFELAPFDWIDCAGRGGCQATHDLELCDLPCPNREPLRSPSEPMPPEPPRPPEMAQCPEGWTRTIVEQTNVTSWCAPPERIRCAAIDEAQRTSASTCTTIGDACPPGEWPAVIPSGSVVYVDDDAILPGDGTLALPFSTIFDAVSSTTSGATIVIAKGVYSAGVPMSDADFAFVGACARETIITGSFVVSRGAYRFGSLMLMGDPSISATTATVTAGGIVFDGAGSSAFGIVGSTGSVIRGRNLSARGYTDKSFAVNDSDMELIDTVITGGIGGAAANGPRSRLRLEAVGIYELDPESYGAGVIDGGRLEVVDSLLHGSITIGIGVTNATVTVSRTIVATSGQAAIAMVGSFGHVGEVEVRGALQEAVHVGEASTLSARDLVIHDLALEGATGLRVVQESRAVVERAAIANVPVSGVSIASRTATISDLAVSGVGDTGVITVKGDLILDRVTIEDCRGHGIRSEGPGSSVRATNVIVRRGISDESFAAFGGHGRFDLERIRVESTTGRAMQSDGRSLQIRDGYFSDNGTATIALFGVDAILARVVIERSSGRGLVVTGKPGEAATLVAHELRVSDCASHGIDLDQTDASLNVVRVERSGDRNIYSHGMSMVIAAHVFSGGAHRFESPFASWGISNEESTLLLENFELRDNGVYGIEQGLLGEVRLKNGLITGHGIGAKIQSRADDISGVIERVEYRDNEIEIEGPDP